MEQDALGEANMSSASPEMNIVLWNLQVRYCCHSSPPLIPELD